MKRNILSENMKRFGTKNLTEAEIDIRQRGGLLYNMASWIVRKLGNPNSVDALSDQLVNRIIIEILRLKTDADFINFIEINMGDGYVNDYIEKHGYEWPPNYADNNNDDGDANNNGYPDDTEGDNWSW